MKKLFSSLFIVMMIALAFTAVASAAEVYAPVDGLYNIEYSIDAEDGTQFGMVVIEAEEDAAFALDEATIRYIDQVAAEDGAITFGAFAPMDLKNEGTYKVYIGGGDLDEATLIGTLGVATEEEPDPDEPGTDPDPEPTVIDGDVDFNGIYNTADALYLVNHLALGDFGLYPVSYPKSLDFDSNGAVNTADALYLVNNLALGDFGMYPLYPQN